MSLYHKKGLDFSFTELPARVWYFFKQLLSGRLRDPYVPYIMLPSSLARLMPSIEQRRRYFWISVAQKYPGFAPFYSEPSSIESENRIITELANSGSYVANDFLTSDDLTAIKKQISDLLFEGDTEWDSIEEAWYLARDHGVPFHTIIDLPAVVKQNIQSQVSEDLQGMYPRDCVPNVFMQVLFSEGNDVRGTNTRWHVDRFVPLVKCLIFPFGCEWGSTERMLYPANAGNKDFLEFVDLYSYTEEVNLLNVGEFKRFDCDLNTAIYTENTRLHRRPPVDSAGLRICIFVEWYDCFSRFRLLRETCRELIGKK